MLIKVCGMRQMANIGELCKLKPDYIGFVFYSKSPRYVGEILTPESTRLIPSEIKKTGVFVNESLKIILSEAKKYSLDAIQLHGVETPEFCRQLKAEGFEILKAINPETSVNSEGLTAYEAVCDFFLFDTPSANHGGTGRKFNWELLNKYAGNRPFFLSGGIGPDDAGEVLAINNKYLAGIDINSRFETAPALKNIDAIKLFIDEFKHLKH